MTTNPLVRVLRAITYNGLEVFGRYYSSYRAWVYSNEDPDNMGRVQLVIPHINGSQVYKYWAYPKGVFAGENYGSQVLPQKGDLVWVEFEGGSPSVPIWQHGYFGKKEVPKDEDLNDKQCYWFLTPKGNLVKLHDTKNLIHIKNTGGAYLEINESSISFVTPGGISLGKLNTSKYKGVLGEELKDILSELLSTLRGASIIGSSFSPGTITQLTQISAKLSKILSDKVTLE